jgi:hypothetical protein
VMVPVRRFKSQLSEPSYGSHRISTSSFPARKQRIRGGLRKRDSILKEEGETGGRGGACHRRGSERRKFGQN